MNLFKLKIKYLIFAILIILFDLYTKHLANKYLIFNRSIKITSFFNFTLLYNYGVAFSILNNTKILWQTSILLIISISVVIVFIYIIIKYQYNKKLNIFSFTIILAGTLGNFYDRVFYGYVIDFLDFHINKYHWPSFNIADLSITSGCILLIISSLSKK